MKQELLELNQDVSVLLQNAKKVPGVSDNSFANWEKTVGDIHRQISEETVRAAVVGAIKSGKSTFINALLKDDYLKRGAGVVTSIVTRVSNGESLCAKLYLKSWDEVNEDLNQALVLFPSFKRGSESDPVDIRRKSDREELEDALKGLDADFLFTQDARNVNSVLISSYLEGYERVKDVMSLETEVREYGDGDFARHRDFSGDDSLAVYLKDIKLEIVGSSLDDNVEIADCQGSDSPNPLHLAMIQDYMLRTHLIVYVISSRTGLRRADIRFLSMIRKMGIMDNVIFVVNCDVSEHESLGELEKLSLRTGDEIALIKSDPELYTFSALYELFKANVAKLSERDTARLWQWQKEKEIASFSDRQYEAFHKSLKRKLTSEKYFLLLKNHLERMAVVVSGLDGWIGVSSDILARDAEGASEITAKVSQHQRGISQIESVIKNTLDGAVTKLKKELRNDLDSFFDLRYGKNMVRITDFIRAYSVTYDAVEDQLKVAGFKGTLFAVFQDFKQGLDSFMTESVNPEIIHFIREVEKKTQEYLMLTARPYDGLIQEALSEYNQTMLEFGIELKEQVRPLEFPGMDSVKKIAGLDYPPARASLKYSARIRTEAFMRLGVSRFAGFVRKIFKRPAKDRERQAFEALKVGVARIKRETEKSVEDHFKNYRENMKFQYVFRLVDAVSNALHEALRDRFQAYVTDLSMLVEGIREHKEDKDDAQRLLAELARASAGLQDRIERVREGIAEATQ